MTELFKIEAFLDGACPLCAGEVSFSRRLDRRRRILFTDNISDASFDAASCGRSFDQLMAEMHARLPDGRWITGVEVFRRLCGAVGLRWLVAPTRLPRIAQSLDLAYRVFARNRLRLTGRCDSGNCYVDHDCQPTGQQADEVAS